jgi:hypothetical protein
MAGAVRRLNRVVRVLRLGELLDLLTGGWLTGGTLVAAVVSVAAFLRGAPLRWVAIISTAILVWLLLGVNTFILE